MNKRMAKKKMKKGNLKRYEDYYRNRINAKIFTAIMCIRRDYNLGLFDTVDVYCFRSGRNTKYKRLALCCCIVDPRTRPDGHNPELKMYIIPRSKTPKVIPTECPLKYGIPISRSASDPGSLVIMGRLCRLVNMPSIGDAYLPGGSPVPPPGIPVPPAMQHYLESEVNDDDERMIEFSIIKSKNRSYDRPTTHILFNKEV